MRREEIERALDRVNEFVENYGNPANEGNTKQHVIVPLLHGMGYSNFDLSTEESNGSGFSDYMVLPKTPHTWYLEAKAWNLNLKDNDIHQAINYAHSAGKRWVVLSNGKEWRLYDDQIQNVENPDRLVARASIADRIEFLDLLVALSKESIQSGDISRSVVATKLRSVIEPQLVDPASDINKKLVQVLKQSPGMHDIKAADIANYFKQRQMAPLRNPPDTKPVELPVLFSETTSLEKAGWTSLETNHTHKKVRSIRFGNEPEIPATTWKQVARKLLLRAKAAHKLPPLPFHIGKSKTPFLAISKDGMREGAVLDETIFFESHFSANDMVSKAILACEAGGYSDWKLVKICYVEQLA